MNQAAWYVRPNQFVYEAILPYSIEDFVHVEKDGSGQIFPLEPSRCGNSWNPPGVIEKIFLTTLMVCSSVPSPFREANCCSGRIFKSSMYTSNLFLMILSTVLPKVGSRLIGR